MKNIKYKFTLETDNGKTKIGIVARNLQSATQQVLNAEGCPESAITNIRIKQPKKEK